MQKRSESDMLDMRPIKVKLGKKEYEIPVLNNRKSAEWREKLYQALGPLVSSFDFSAIDLNANRETVSQMMSSSLTSQLIAFPQKLSELLVEFAPDLPKEALDDASDEQIGIAFSACAEVGYPFFFHLWATKRALAMPPEKKIPTPAARLQ